MTGPALRDGLLLGGAVLGLAFYVGAPMFYSYADAISLRIGGIPGALYDLPPLSLWAALPAAYAPQDEGAVAASGELSCSLQWGDAVTRRETAAGCAFRVPAGNAVAGPSKPLPQGYYVASFVTDVAPGCAGGQVSVAVTAWRPLVMRDVAVDASAMLELPFSYVGTEYLERLPVDLRLATSEGCVLLTGIAIRTAE